MAEAHTHRTAHPEAQCQHHIQIVVRHLILLAVCGSCSEKPNNCIFNQFAILKDVLDMLADRPLGLAEQLGQLLLVQPKAFPLQHYVYARGAIFTLVNQELLGFGHIFILPVDLAFFCPARNRHRRERSLYCQPDQRITAL
jgi:hypothetical protein